MSDKIIQAVRDLDSSRASIENHFRGLIAELGDIVNRSEEASRHFFATYEAEDMHKALDARLRRSAAEELSYILRKQVEAGQLSGERFRTKHPQFREALKAAAEFRLKNARKEFERVLAAEKKRLSPKGFEKEQIVNSPEVKRSRGVVENYERLLAQIKDDIEETVWRNATSLLDP